MPMAHTRSCTHTRSHSCTHVHTCVHACIPIPASTYTSPFPHSHASLFPHPPTHPCSRTHTHPRSHTHTRSRSSWTNAHTTSPPEQPTTLSELVNGGGRAQWREETRTAKKRRQRACMRERIVIWEKWHLTEDDRRLLQIKRKNARRPWRMKGRSE